jgi:FlaA1/EpsC-like NDP-sugar epimerase
MVTMPSLYFFSRLYDVKRSMPRLDEFYRIFAATSIGTVVTIAFTTFLFKNSALELDFPRVMVIYAWLLTVVLVTFSRSFLVLLRNLAAPAGRLDRPAAHRRDRRCGAHDPAKGPPDAPPGLSVVGLSTATPRRVQEIMGVPVLGGVDDIPTSSSNTRSKRSSLAGPSSATRSSWPSSPAVSAAR